MHWLIILLIIGIAIYIYTKYTAKEEAFIYTPWRLYPNDETDDNPLMNENRIPQDIFSSPYFCGNMRNSMNTAYPYHNQFDLSNDVTDRMVIKQPEFQPYNVDAYSVDFSINYDHTMANSLFWRRQPHD